MLKILCNFLPHKPNTLSSIHLDDFINKMQTHNFNLHFI